MTDRILTRLVRPRLRPLLIVTVMLAVVAVLALREGVGDARDGGSSDNAVSGWYLVILGGLSVLTTLLAARQERTPAAHPADEPADQPADERTDESADAPARDRWAALSPVACLALIAAYIIAFPWIGFAATNAGFLLLYLKGIARYGWLRSVVYAALIDVVFVVFFSQVGVSLPTGPFLY